jgi:hypothetical protein
MVNAAVKEVMTAAPQSVITPPFISVLLSNLVESAMQGGFACPTAIPKQFVNTQ